MGESPSHQTGEHPVPAISELMDVILDRYPEMLLQHLQREAAAEALPAEET